MKQTQEKSIILCKKSPKFKILVRGKRAVTKESPHSLLNPQTTDLQNETLNLKNNINIIIPDKRKINVRYFNEGDTKKNNGSLKIP